MQCGGVKSEGYRGGGVVRSEDVRGAEEGEGV